MHKNPGDSCAFFLVMRHMLKIVNYFFLLLVISILGGCSTINYPETLGLSNTQWQSLSQDQQATLIASSKSIEQQSAPLLQKKPTATDTTFLAVKISGGKVMMPPFNSWVSYQPAAFTITSDECKDIELLAKTGEGKVTLRSCWQRNILFVDPSRYDTTKKMGSINIYFSPLWVQGFAYTGINTSGYARLRNATIEIKQHAKSAT